MNNQAPRLIEQYSADLNDRDLFAAAGQQCPRDVAERISHVENMARTNLSPSQQQEALQHVARCRLADSEQRMQTQQGDEAAFAQVQVDKGRQKLLHDMGDGKKPMTVKQYKQAHETGKFSIENRPKQILRYFDDLKKTSAQQYGRSWESVKGDLDELFVVEPHKLAERAEELGIKLDDAEAWREHGIGMTLMERCLDGAQKEPDTEEHTLSDHQERKMDVIDSATWQDDGSAVDNRPISQELLDDDGRVGDVARAFEQVEDEADIQAATEEAFA